LNSSLSGYQRANAAIGTFFGGMSGSGDFLGGLSTVRTLDGGNITILSPHGQIQVGLVSPPSNFPGYSIPSNATWALNFGVVTEKGGDVDLYANGNISVNQSRVFTLEGGDLIAVSQNGNIDAGKGAKTVQTVQPPNVSYDGYGDITITPFGPASGSGLAVLRALPGVPLGNADLIAFNGFINAGDAGIRVSGNINLAAVAVINASNITVGGSATGIPVVQGPPVSASTTASNTAGANQAVVPATTGSTNNNQASIIIVEVVGYGRDGDEPAGQGQQRPKTDDKRSYDVNSPFQVIGAGSLNQMADKYLTDEERRRLSAQ
jgi:Filamentous haemagglutinin family outer membrane protein